MGTTSTGCSSGIPSMGGWQSNSLSFSYVNNTVTQTVTVPDPSTVVFDYTAVNRPEEWINGRFNVVLSDSDQSETSGYVVPPRTATNYSLTVTTTQVNESVTISISGDDNGLFWAGCYGPTLTNASLNATPTSVPLPPNAMWAEINEGGSQIIAAPQGSVFTSVYYASYGNPTGSNGVYENGWCHAANSVQKIEEAVLGQNSAVLLSNNGVFGDPCGGTYKRLYVTLLYSEPSTPPTTTTTTLPSCGPYQTISVTGQLQDGPVWGSDPYTDDSDFDVAAVHAGLVEVGESAVIEPYDVQYYLSYPQSTANGVTTYDWLSGWCGYRIRLLSPPTTTSTTVQETTTTTSTTVQETTTSTSTTLQETTTTTIAPTTTEVPETTEVTTTTIAPEPETTTTTIMETTTSGPTTTTPQTTVPKPTTVPENATTSTSTTVTTTIPETTTTQPPTTTTPIPTTSTVVIPEIQPEMTSEEVVEVLTNPEVLEELSNEQLEQVFENLDVEELSDAEVEQLVETLSDASDEVKATFEEKVNIYDSEKFANYVPQGSTITVQERRVMIVVSTVMATMGAGVSAPRRRQGG